MQSEVAIRSALCKTKDLKSAAEVSGGSGLCKTIECLTEEVRTLMLRD